MVITRAQREATKSELPKAGVKRRRFDDPPKITKNITKRTTKSSKSSTLTPKSSKSSTRAKVITKEKTKAPKTANAVLSKAKEKQIQKNEIIDQSNSLKPVAKQLENVSQELVNNVRRRELQQKLDIENCTKEKLHTKSLLCRIPSICSHLRSYYRSQKKTVMEMDLIIKQLCSMTTPPVQKEDMIEVVDLLVEVAPSWCNVLFVNEKKYLKINTSKPISDVKIEITNRTEELGL